MTGWSVGTLASMKHNASTGGAVGVRPQPVVSHGATMREVRCKSHTPRPSRLVTLGRRSIYIKSTPTILHLAKVLSSEQPSRYKHMKEQYFGIPCQTQGSLYGMMLAVIAHQLHAILFCIAIDLQSNSSSTRTRVPD